MGGVEIAVLSLAAYRVYRLLAIDDLPPMTRAREWVIQRWKGAGDEHWHTGITCRWCLGSVVGAALVAGYAQVVSVRLPGIYALAVCTLIGLVGRFDDAAG